MINIDNYKRALSNLPSEIKEAEFNIEENQSQSITVSGGQITDNLYSDLIEIFVRVSSEKTGYAYSQDVNEQPLDIIRRAYENSLYIDSFSKDTLNEEGMISANFSNQCSNIDEMYNYATKLQNILLDCNDSIKEVSVEARSDKNGSVVINSFGMEKSFERKVMYLSARVVAEKNNKQYNAEFALSNDGFENIDLDEFKMQVVRQLKSQFEPVAFRSGTYAAVLDRTVMVNILMTAWQCFSGMKYIDGSSVLSGKLGLKICSDAFSVIDVKRHENTGYQFMFDCEGTECVDNLLVDKGIMNGLLHNIKSAEALNMKPAGNAGRYALLSGSIPTDIIVTPRILHVIPGSYNISELLNQLKDGVYITESYDVFHSINIASGNFSIPCRGTVIRNGIIVENITELTMSGNLEELFRNIVGIGSDLYIEEFLKKSYCIGSPSVLVSGLKINAG